MIPAFNLFMGDSEHRNSAQWLEAVDGLTEAEERLRQIARERPGHSFFVFDLRTRKVLLRIVALETEGPKAMIRPCSQHEAANPTKHEITAAQEGNPVQVRSRF